MRASTSSETGFAVGLWAVIRAAATPSLRPGSSSIVTCTAGVFSTSVIVGQPVESK